MGCFEVIDAIREAISCWMVDGGNIVQSSGLHKVRQEWGLHASRIVLCALEQSIVDLLHGNSVEW